MKLAIFQEVIDVTSLDALHERLQSRHDDTYGSFWIWHPTGTELALMINGEDAYLFFTSADGDPRKSPPLGKRVPTAETYVGCTQSPLFYTSYSEGIEAPDELVEFLADNFESTPVTRNQTVPLSQAIKAVDDFFDSGERSKTIQWLLLELPPAPPRKPWWRLW